MHYSKTLLFFLFVWIHFAVNAQPIKRYKTFTYSVNEGLLQSTIAGLEVDKNNFLWISFPNGIQKFDGQNFTFIPIQPGLPDDKDAYFFRCKNGDLLISHSMGISKYDINRNSFELIFEHLSYNNISPFFLGEDDGIIYFSPVTGIITEMDSHSFKIIAETEMKFAKDLSKLSTPLKVSPNIIDHKVTFLHGAVFYLWDLQKRKLLKQSKAISLIVPFLVQMQSSKEVLFYKEKSPYLYSYDFSTGLITSKAPSGFKDHFISRSNIFKWNAIRLSCIADCEASTPDNPDTGME